MRFSVLILLTALGLAPVLSAEPASDPKPPPGLLEHYLNRSEEQRFALRDVSMEVDIEADLPRLNKTGKLHALRHISRVGKVTYSAVSFIGDNIIKKDVIARYLQAEVKSTADGDVNSIAITPANYKFKYRGIYGTGDWKLHLFELSPRKKRVGLFEGWLWLEATTGLPVRESGRFVRNPSVFLRRVEFVRDYEIRDGISVPVRIDSSIHTRIVGMAKLAIRFSNVSPNSERAELSEQGLLASQ